MKLTKELLTGAAVLAALVSCHLETKIPERMPKVVRSSVECEVYQGYTNGAEGIPGRFIFDPLPPHARKLEPKHALIGRPELKDSLTTRETYCFIRRNGDTLESIYSPIQPGQGQAEH